MTLNVRNFIINEMCVDVEVYQKRISLYSDGLDYIFEEVGDYLLNYEILTDREQFIEDVCKFIDKYGVLSEETYETLHILIRAFKIYKTGGLLELYLYNESESWEPLPKITKNLYHLMTESDKKTFNNLPDIVEIYRGTSIIESEGNILDFGQSWSLDIEKARYFAYELEQEEDKNLDRIVLKCEVFKSHIYAFSHHQSEELCIINPKGIITDSVKVIE
ncbi:hypothetical protein [Arcobacter arenosus]|uniref:Uncharacterized protein n=1 Tax=Arcobacter arenosus TaxID=2576037 RepID=A0A5R8XXR7_9BACT|nr:hypothetical protein [Arcobacter arenosus]TLP36214.1 hypothetical protein FDK22_13165 [Arcobacter arenosus]